MAIELTDADVAAFAETARDALKRSAGQVAQLRQGFPVATTEDILAMEERIRNDPATGRGAPIDGAIYFLALHKITYENAQAALDALTSNGTPAILNSLLLALLTCADIVNALTFLSRGGLAKQLHIEEMQGVARSAVARSAAATRHEKTNAAKLWVQQQWNDHGHTHESKAAFVRHIVDRVKERWEITVSAKTIAEEWLKPAALKH